MERELLAVMQKYGRSFDASFDAFFHASFHAIAMRLALPLVALLFVALLFASAAGCSRSRPLEYSVGGTTQALPPTHQQQIAAALSRLFGSPDQPKLMIPSDEQEESQEAEPTLEGLKLVASSATTPARLLRGAGIYSVRCAGCHGVSGDGAGEAAPYLQPKPRDYRRGEFKFTSTPFGAKPARIDLVRTIRRGAKGTSMPAFPWMADEDLEAVIDYVILLSQRGEVELRAARAAELEYDEDQSIDVDVFTDAAARVARDWRDAETKIVHPVTPEPAFDRASILEGRKIFVSVSENCWKCHGKDARGQTEWLSHEFLAAREALPEDQRIAINRDAWGEVAPAADITARMLHGGRRPIDVYRRIYTGINGTPMPAFGQTYAADPDKIWHLVHYVLSIVEGGAVAPDEPSAAAPGDAQGASPTPES